jgi:uncharacterized protein (DUF1800 family)
VRDAIAPQRRSAGTARRSAADGAVLLDHRIAIDAEKLRIRTPSSRKRRDCHRNPLLFSAKVKRPFPTFGLHPLRDAMTAIPFPEPFPAAQPPTSRTDAAPPAGASSLCAAPLPVLGAAALQACGGGGGASPGGTGTGSAAATGAAPAATAAPADGPAGRRYAMAGSDAEAARFLLQAQFSASDEEIAKVRGMGYAAWLATQFAALPGVGAWDWLNQRGYGAVDNARYYDNTYPGDHALWFQLFNAPDAVRKRVALALSEIFVVSLSGIDVSWRSHLVASYFDMLSANALGSFRTLLEQVTLHPAMGVFLNTRGNQKANAAGRQPDENYAREVMQLMTIGPVALGPDGTPQRGAGGGAAESYTLDDVTNLARVFTGWDFDQSQNQPTTDPAQNNRSIPGLAFTRLPMAFDASRHSTQDASFLGATVGGSAPGPQALAQALDTLAGHANTAPFIGRQLIQRLVTSNPSAAYVGRVAAAFADNGSGRRGDLATVVAAVLLDDEARAPAGLADPAFGRVREPMLRLVQWGRTFGLRSARGSWKLGDLSDPATRLGQSPMRSPSVFNFFRPGYVPPSTAMAERGLVAPEFQLVNETSVGGYLNFIQGAARNGLYVNAPDVPQSASNAANGFDLTAAYTRELALSGSAADLLARLNTLLAAGQVSADNLALMARALDTAPLAVTATGSATAQLDRVGAAVLMVMACPEYLVQK